MKLRVTLTGHFHRFSFWKHSSEILVSRWCASITQLLHICRLHILHVNLKFHHIQTVRYGIWWPWISSEYSELLIRVRMEPSFHVVYTKSWPSHLNVAAEIKTHQMRVHFSNFLLSSFAKLQLQFFVFSWQEWYSVWSCGAAVRLLRHLCSEMLFMVAICDYLIYCHFSVTMSTMSSPFPLTSDMKRAFFL